MKKALTLFTLLFTNAAFASEPFDYIDLAYSQQNTDWHNYTDSSSATVKTGVSAGDYVQFRARYHDGNVQMPPNVQQETWTAYGVGFRYPVSESLWLYIGGDHNELELRNRPTERGWYNYVGARYQATPQWQFALEAGETDVVFRDTTFVVETVYNFHSSLGLSATLRDYDDLDLTEYEIGLRWFFRN
ncbi:hypothetical protein FHR99_001383 [Litorivivens lipolytica]|uniref:Outer membrane protein beta-barrel domain-containing protein n=1 Tax=Litorivivens lipolytica TaxID=1524264 RepID=A0A7W4Z5I0_9GAMM|nr:outer membrane beta-barrel protein [Litorivivens lipolytica]MBB3047147.1 hypothetical protein [Litorivivens lipolytica]